MMLTILLFLVPLKALKRLFEFKLPVDEFDPLDT